MTTTPAETGAETLCTWSAAHIPPGTPLRHRVDATGPEIRLVIGDPDRVELSMDPIMAGELVQTLRAAVHEYNAAHSIPPSGPYVA